MKTKIKFFIIIVFFSCLFNSCVKLDETPPGLLAPQTFYKTQADFDAAIVGCYRPLFYSYTAFDYDFPYMAGAGAEDIATKVSRWLPIEQLTASASQFNEITAPLWTMSYASIGNASAIISKLKDVQGIPAASIAEYDGEAKFLRAFNYFNLTRWFGEVPIVPYEEQSHANEIGQSPVADIYALIVQDLTDAEAELPVSLPDRGKATKGAAKALLAKVYLTMAGWPLNDASKYTLARDKAKEVIDMGIYQLVNNFADLWLVANKLTNKEFIFALYGSADGGIYTGSHLHFATRPWDHGDNGWGDFESDKRFFAMFPDGPRKDATFYTTLADGTPWEQSDYTEPYIAKYRDAGSSCPFSGDCKGEDGSGFSVMLRYADVLLIYAEAANQAEGGPSADALEAINKVRRRANGKDPNTPDVASDLGPGIMKDDFDKAVLDERNWELAFENNRWFDLVRRNKVVEVMGAWYPGVTEDRMLLPKPIKELTLVKGLTQNKGY